MNPSSADIPVTVLGGYLGAGKTTLINRLLNAAPDWRLGVLVNDFGSVNVDSELIAQRDDATLALTNGCVCCAAGDRLADALAWLGDAGVDAALIETSGVALPARIANAVCNWPGLRLNGTVVVLDALNYPALKADRFVGRLVQDQARQGDLRLLSKLDALPPTDRPGARFCGLDFLDARDWPMAELMQLQRNGQAQEASLPLEDGPAHQHFYSSSFETTALLEPTALAPVLTTAARTAWRLKGWYTDPNGAIWTVQQVGEKQRLAPWQESSTPAIACRLCAIGIVPLDALATRFQSLQQPEE